MEQSWSNKNVAFGVLLDINDLLNLIAEPGWIENKKNISCSFGIFQGIAPPMSSDWFYNEDDHYIVSFSDEFDWKNKQKQVKLYSEDIAELYKATIVHTTYPFIKIGLSPCCSPLIYISTDDCKRGPDLDIPFYKIDSFIKLIKSYISEGRLSKNTKISCITRCHHCS